MTSKARNNLSKDPKVVQLEAKVCNLESNFNTFCTTQFEHLREKVESLDDKLMWGFIITIASMLIMQVVLKFF
jgi:hypothetical protein